MDKQKKDNVHPFKPKPVGMDSNGNIRKKIYMKQSGTTMTIAKDVAVPVARSFISEMRRSAKEHGIELLCNPIVKQ